jgi:uncharacterized protein YutD
MYQDSKDQCPLTISISEIKMIMKHCQYCCQYIIKLNEKDERILLNTKPSLSSTKNRMASSAAPLAIIPSLSYSQRG